jgi:hypothetical protein
MSSAISDTVQSDTIDPSDPQDAKLHVAAARHVEPMSEPVAVPKKFMASTWHQNTSLWKLITETRDPFKAMLYDLMYHGPLPQKEGKLPFISVWQQRMCLHACCPSSACYFCAFVPRGIATPPNASTPQNKEADRILLPLCR